jgi:hypothetical protein
MGSLTTPGDLAGMVLLAVAILVVAGRLAAGRVGPSRPAVHERTAEQRHQSGHPAWHQHQMSDPAPPAQPAVVVPWQSTWQSRAAQPSDLVEDRVPGPAALQLEEAIGSRDQ